MTAALVEHFLNGKMTLHCGDCIEVLAGLEPCSIDSAVTDPPYHLISIGARFGAPNAKPPNSADNLHQQYNRLSRGFMGRTWDGGDVAFRAETWAAVYRVLKPGGYVLAFGGTRTYHRMACAIEDAGFDVRDMVSWLYGSGFPKSHDVSKGIDRAAGATREIVATKKWTPGPTFTRVGQASQEYRPDGDVYPCEIVGKTYSNPATDAAREWQGWGTALKPALEPICMARKPLAERTVAANVLRWGTGAINIDACRVGAGTGEPKPEYEANGKNAVYGDGMGGGAWANTTGRWPANVVHDGSEEVVAAFPDADGAVSNGRKGVQGLYEDGIGVAAQAPSYGDSGSAARFFYSAKADSNDRLGSKHPTVKPVDLMQYLVRLVTPRGGVCLDPFAGTGTTGEAAWREGMRAVLVEAEPEYQADIRRRMALALAGPDERMRESIKARGTPIDYGPLFATLREAAE